jgi:hypothetical protein
VHPNRHHRDRRADGHDPPSIRQAHAVKTY